MPGQAKDVERRVRARHSSPKTPTVETFVSAGQLRADRGSFFAYASQVMRSVNLNSVRERQAERRGGDATQLTPHTELADSLSGDEDTIPKVHEALFVLEQADARLA